MTQSTAEDDLSSTTKSTSGNLTKERAKARWSILRDALLQTKASLSNEHSIHRFPGYQLVKRQTCNVATILSPLKCLEWNAAESTGENVERLSLACLALAAACPKGKCVDLIHCPTDKEFITQLQQACHPAVSVLVVQDKPPTLTVLVQECSSATKFTIWENVLDANCSIWTREPRETRLSLEDLVSHRRTGVDNTGNVCVWDSERTLTYLLYYCYDDFSCLKSPPSRILELGTGMAGLAAVALGMRIVQNHTINDESSKIQVTLTDGHPEGVHNNKVNQLLTQLSISSDDNASHHPYNSLSISEQVLLWTTDLEDSSSDAAALILQQQDVVLVSDCTHFQKFHAALAVTTLRSLRVGGVAMFCQPTRGDSLDNFCKLITTTNLVSLEWWSHPILTTKDEQATKQYPELYDRNLHCPKVLLVRKLRDLTEGDCHEFVSRQEPRK